ncbi:MAG: serine/threonine-protein kinase [Fuerstiella sp.]
MAPRKLGPFQLERQIGVGGMGIVYSAIYPANGKRVAVKVLSPGLMTDPKLLKRFEREIEILKRLSHPNIVKYYGGGFENNQRYYAMEYIDGGSLQDVLKQRGRLSWEHALHIGRQVSSALEHAHNAGIIHRDLKPANLFLTKKGRLKLGDFGIARDTEATALTAAGKTVGTYAYMAPEQIQAGFPISGRTDLYALGCLLYEVIVGETPFQSDTPVEMLMQHLNDAPYNICEKVPDCPIWLDQLVERLLAKNPEDRPYDALAVHTELGEIREKVKAGNSVALAETAVAGKVPAKSVKEKPQLKKRKKKKKKGKNVPFHEQTWFLAACLVAVVGATVWLLMPPGEDWYADRWREAMQGDEYAQRASLEKHIDVYLERFADGRYADKARELSDTLHANMLEPQLKNLARLDRPVEPPFKAACVEAARLEDEEGLLYTPTWDERPDTDLKTNPLPALERWKALAESGRDILEQAQKNDEPTDEIRWLIRLCENHHAFFRQKLIDSSQGRRFLHDRMKTAEGLLTQEEPDPEQAVRIWSYCYKEFNRVQRFQDFAEYARQRSLLSDAVLPDAETETESTPDASDGAGPSDGT